ncbi:MAG: response regulator transcription factor [Treponema sp.]|jgi:DNA-binding NarL/FixJ family response regulator|nr:response regulator transcription factor [Treponema sp.]
MIKIIIIDSDETERYRLKDGFSSQSDFDVIGIGKDCYDAIKLVGSKRPDIVIMDIALKDGDGIDLIPLLKSKSPNTAVVLFTNFEDEEHIYKALVQKPAGYIVKRGGVPNLCGAIKNIRHGDCFIGSQIASKVCSIFSHIAKRGIYSAVIPHNKQHPKRKPAPSGMPSGISGMEMRIIGFIAQGYSTHEMAERLSITDGTARNYISAVMRKVGVSNRSQLALFAIHHGLVPV